MKILLSFFSTPFILLSRFAVLFNLWNIRNDIRYCLEVVDIAADSVPEQFVTTLIAAEDHRSHLHCGIDPIAILRAVCSLFFQKKIQGASTVEQQLVRVVLGRYERTFLRKIREQVLAVSVSERRTKAQIASTYLAIAFYGSGCVGLVGLKRVCGPNLRLASPNAIRGMIARLKYPKPTQPLAAWYEKYYKRIDYIARRQDRLTNGCSGLLSAALQATPDP